MNDRACGFCKKRFETGNPAAALECRALPPVQGVGRFAAFPLVKPDDFCHLHFEDARAAIVAPLLGEDGQPANPPAGDLAADIANPQPLKRARRARPADADEPKLL
jgi:hypothetical protein